MQKSPSADTPENWGAASRGYAKEVAPRMMETFAQEFIDRLDVRADSEALEVASGSGAFTATLAGKAKSLLATDFAPKMLEVLRERMKDKTNIAYRVMDGQALELDDASFDRAACCFAVMLFPDRARGFSELRRVLRPGGRAMISGWAGPDKFGAFELFMSAVAVAFPDLPPPATPPPVFSLADTTDFKSQMEAAGFADVEVEYVSRDLELPDFQSVWSMMTVGAPPVQMLLDRLGPDGEERVHGALATIVEERFGSGPVRVTNTATLGVGAVS